MNTAESVVVEFPAAGEAPPQPTPKVREKLPALEAKLLRKQERIIAEEGFPGMMKLVDAFKVIRDGRLYRAEYDTFAEYCQKKWKREKDTINKLIQAREVREEMNKILFNDEPTKELLASTSDHAVRELGKVEPEKREEVFKRAAEESNGAPTAKAVEEASGRLTEAELAEMDRKEQQFADCVGTKRKPKANGKPHKRHAATKPVAKPSRDNKKNLEAYLSEFDQW